ncbi:3',5'-cyclic AMP phosphodiesterase CpdA [Halovenus aranensis]|uniref:3',5'-cyclic AMP phosphodiesterase CpdA n=1 Tax=Halovenus aranensis TaxID=890420 RepID=A0A1G8YFW5_9EURY|nr:metallophosphoesterase [Halovenus aranensis]SDK01718.1 3',5'-cyclic AMP phosphodiesterase CpdA [Halovenus aranensis]
MFSENGAGDHSGQPLFPDNGGATLARFDRPRGSGTTVAVLSDPHVTPTARGSATLYHRTKQRFQMAVADAHRLDVDGTVVAGDLTKDGSGHEYRLGDTLVGTLPEPRLVVPGDHDLGPARELETGGAFARRYGHRRYPTAIQMGDLAVCGLDSTRPAAAHSGGILRSDPRQRPDAAGPRIAVLHHQLAPLPEPFEGAVPESEYRVQNPAATADALAAAGVDLVITGHLHWPFATTYRGLNVVSAPGCSTFPPGYLLVRVDSRGTTVSLVSLAGERGLAEAYDYTLEDDARGDPVRSAVRDGYFGTFPQVDEQTGSGDETPLSDPGPWSAEQSG